MQTLLSGVKSYIPKLTTGYVEHNNLIDKINSGINKKLTIISAPAGFGKTSLLSKWTENINQEIVWLSLDKSDNNISFFFSYLIDSLNQIKKGFGVSLQSSLNSISNFEPDFFAKLFSDEISKFFEKCIIIFDDFNQIENKQILNFISNLLLKPDNLHIIISTRTKPEINFSKLKLNDSVNEIDIEDLRFDKQAQNEFLKNNFSIELSNEQLNNLDSKIEGWVAGLQFSALFMKKNSENNFKDLIIDNSVIEDYIINEVFNNQSDEVKNFLIKTSILKYFNNDLSNYMLGISNSEEIIKKLKNENLFIVELDRNNLSSDLYNDKWYRYHHVFKNLLNKKLKNINQDDIKELQNRAIEWFEKNNLIMEALSHCLENKEYDKYCNLLTKISMETVMTGELELYKNLTGNVPETVLSKYSFICLCLGWTNCLTHNLELVEKYIEYAEQGDDFPDREIHIELLKAYYYTLYFKADISYFKRCIDLIYRLKKEVKDDILKSSVERILGGLYLVIEDWEAALESFLVARNLGKSAKNHIVWLSSTANYSLLLIFCGEFIKAKKICQETIKEINIIFESNNSPLLAYIYQPLGKILYEENQIDEAINYFEKSVVLAQKIDNKFLQITSFLDIAVIYANEKNLKKSLEYLEKSESMLEDTPIYKDIFIEFNLLKLWDIHKKNDQINIFMEKYNAEKKLKHSVNEYKEIIYAKILLKQNKIKESEEVLKNLISQKENYYDNDQENTKSFNRFFYLETLILLSYVYKKNLNITKAIETLKKAINYADEKHYFRTFINEYKQISDIVDLIIAENNNSYNNYLFKIIKKDEENKTSNIYLSEREIEIIKLLSIGFTNQEIAEKLILALGTVKKHTNSIYQKLNVNNRVSAIQKAGELGVL